MKKTIIFFFMVVCSTSPVTSQGIHKLKQSENMLQKIDTKEFKGVKVRSFDDDNFIPNFRYAVKTTNTTNFYEEARYLNSEYIHSTIGINLKFVSDTGWEKKRKWAKTERVSSQDSLFIIEGKGYQSFTNYICEEYQPQLVTLWDLQKKHAPGIPLKNCLFMIDDILLTTDLIRYKLDPEYLDSVIVIPPRQIQALDKGKYLNLYIFHIYTKETETRKTTALQVKKNYIIGNYTEGKNLLSLQDILDENVPGNTGIQGGYLFMVNEQFILSDLAEIRIVPDYIHTVLVYPPEVLQRISGGVHEQLTIIRVYVKDPETIKKCKWAILWQEANILMSY